MNWQDIIPNEELYNNIGLKPVSEIVKARCSRWFGHMCRLPEDTPVRIDFKESTRDVKKPKGGPKNHNNIYHMVKELSRSP